MSQTELTLRHIARACLERMNALYVRGKKRDDAVLDYFCGAVSGIKIIGYQEEADKLVPFITMILCVEGYRAVERLANEPLTSDDAP